MNNQIQFGMQQQQRALEKANALLNESSEPPIEQTTLKEVKKKSNLPVGVFMSSNNKRYVAKFRKDHIGTYDTPEEASIAYENYKNEV